MSSYLTNQFRLVLIVLFKFKTRFGAIRKVMFLILMVRSGHLLRFSKKKECCIRDFNL